MSNTHCKKYNDWLLCEKQNEGYTPDCWRAMMGARERLSCWDAMIGSAVIPKIRTSYCWQSTKDCRTTANSAACLPTSQASSLDHKNYALQSSAAVTLHELSDKQSERRLLFSRTSGAETSAFETRKWTANSQTRHTIHGMFLWRRHMKSTKRKERSRSDKPKASTEK